MPGYYYLSLNLAMIWIGRRKKTCIFGSLLWKSILTIQSIKCDWVSYHYIKQLRPLKLTHFQLATAYEIAFPEDLMKAEMTYRDAINACLPKDPRSIYAYFKLGVMLAKRRNDADAWKEASTFLRGYKKYLVAISTIMLEEHLLNRTEEENNESVLPYLLDVLHKAESIL